jgi:hypothetical protein
MDDNSRPGNLLIENAKVKPQDVVFILLITVRK